MLTVIFANGDLADSFDLSGLSAKSGRIIAVDGGANHCRRRGIIPHDLIGDLDSIDPAILKEFQEMAVAIHRHPPRKDATDLELALDLVMAGGARQVLLLGGLGGRWDMSLANVLLLAAEKYKTLSFTLPGPDCIMHILHPGEAFTLPGSPGQRVSLLPLQGDVHGLTLCGFEYPLGNATLHFGSTHGVSNIQQDPAATIQFHNGVLLCIRLIAPSYPRRFTRTSNSPIFRA